MSDTTAKRRREKYSKLICLGCRARRIRCILPDIDIVPSSAPQSEDKACQRCRQNGLDCIVDYTTLGRPAQKRNRVVDQVSNQSQVDEPSDILQTSNDDFEESITQNIDDFLLSHPERTNDGAHVRPTKPSKSEMAEAMTSPTHLLTALLTRDKGFASAIGSQPQVTASIMEVIDDRATILLDEQ